MSIVREKRKWRALINLIYSDLVPEKQGQMLARKGEITSLYDELLKYPDRVQLLETRGFIEPLPETPIIRPEKVTGKKDEPQSAADDKD